jgi:drug/metabolite transporter (DMT)-like permease
MTLPAALSGVLVISFSAIFFALADVDPVTGAFYRFAYSLPALFILWFVRRHQDNRPWRKRLMALGAGLALGLDVTLWHTSIGFIGTGLATLLANAQVILVAMFAWLFLGEVPSRRVATAIPVVLIGVGLVSGVGQSDAFGANPLLGTLLAVLAALFYASFILGLRASNEDRAPAAGPLLEATIGATVAVLVISSPAGGIELAPTWPGHAWLLALALGAQTFAWLLIGYALPRLPASETATIIMIQPALTMIWGAVIFSERPSALQVIGAMAVLTGVGYVAAARARRVSQPAPT